MRLCAVCTKFFAPREGKVWSIVDAKGQVLEQNYCSRACAESDRWGPRLRNAIVQREPLKER